MHRVGRFVICVFDRSDRDAAQEFLGSKSMVPGWLWMTVNRMSL